MDVGISMTANRDFMYTGLLARPTGSSLRTDAVVAWGCQSAESTADNFRFIFLEPNANASDQGTEMMRIAPWGNIGMGNSFSNALQPSRRLVVHEEGEDPQLRIAHTLNANPTLGANAELQVSAAGDLYIKPSSDGDVQGVAIGFLEGELTPPAAPFNIQTVLDVGGLTRIRNLRSQGDNDCIVIGSNAQGAADNYIKRLDFTGDPNDYLAGDGTWQQGLSATDCRWTDAPDSFTPDDFMFAGFDPLSSCYRSKLAFGTNTADAKVEIENLTDRDRVSTGLDVVSINNVSSWTANDNNARLIGISSLADASMIDNSQVFHIGIETQAVGGQRAVGLDALADRGVKSSIGVYSLARNTSFGNNIAYYGEVFSALDFYEYNVGGIGGVSTGASINISDESVKTNIEVLEGASDLLSALQVKTYNYVSPENRPIAFSERMQYGLIAQEVANVIPEIVYETTVPEIRDTLGSFIEGTSVDLLGIDYTAIIPILVAGFQEQNLLMETQAATIQQQDDENEALTAQIAELAQQLTNQATQMEALQTQMSDVMSSLQVNQSKMNNCCGVPQESKKGDMGGIELEQNFPNPFENVTTISYSTTYAAQIRLDISDAQGRVLEVLVSGRQEAGEYRVEWDASNVAPGTYYYSLYADTELITKKMIKR
jgi:hypothetical protein